MGNEYDLTKDESDFIREYIELTEDQKREFKIRFLQLKAEHAPVSSVRGSFRGKHPILV